MRERSDRRRRQALVAMVYPGHAAHDVDRTRQHEHAPMTTSPGRAPQGSRRPPKGLEAVRARLSLPRPSGNRCRGRFDGNVGRTGGGRCRWTDGREADGCRHRRGPAPTSGNGRGSAGPPGSQLLAGDVPRKASALRAGEQPRATKSAGCRTRMVRSDVRPSGRAVRGAAGARGGSTRARRRSVWDTRWRSRAVDHGAPWRPAASARPPVQVEVGEDAPGPRSPPVCLRGLTGVSSRKGGRLPQGGQQVWSRRPR